MKGFSKILKFKVFESYDDARKIADDIIISLVKNSGCKTEEEKKYLPTYVSTVRETYLSSFVDCVFKDKDAEEEDDDKRYAEYRISIYEVRGNRKSKLSVSQNKELRELICN